MTLFYYLLNICLIGGLGYAYGRKLANNGLQVYFYPALFLKLSAGILLALYYDTYFGGADAQLFQSQSDLVTEYARVSPLSYLRLLFTRQYESETLRTSMVFFWYSNSYFMVMVLSALNFITGGHHYLNSFYFSFYSFWGLWQLAATLYSLNIKFKFPALLAFLFYPSVVFWSAGVGKEALYLGSLAWMVAAVLRLVYHKNRALGFIFLEILVAGYVLWKIKFYFAALAFALLFGFAAAELITRNFKKFKVAGTRWYFICLVVLVGGLVFYSEKEVINIENFFFQLMRSYTTLSEWSAGKPVLVFSGLEPTLTSVLRHSPSAIFQTILRPYFWEWHNPFYFIAGLENFLVLILLVLTLSRLVRTFPKQIPLLVWATMVYILIIAALIGLFTPNIGSLSRYKTAFMPFLIFLLLAYNSLYPGFKADKEINA